MGSLAIGTNPGVPLWLLAGMLLACDPNCATRVIPPERPDHPTVVFITDYGRHSSVLLPTAEGFTVEYAYGDWDYFALGSYRWYKGALALCWSDQSTLGRRFIPLPADAALLKERLEVKRIIRVEADSAAVARLTRELDARFCRHLDSMVYNGGHQMYFVKDDVAYGLFNNCNNVTADWLQKLGCKIEGFAVLSNFVLAPLAPEAVPAMPVSGRGLPGPGGLQSSGGLAGKGG